MSLKKSLQDEMNFVQEVRKLFKHYIQASYSINQAKKLVKINGRSVQGELRPISTVYNFSTEVHSRTAGLILLRLWFVGMDPPDVKMIEASSNTVDISIVTSQRLTKVCIARSEQFSDERKDVILPMSDFLRGV